ncbi:DUF397 domain-containing protein [Streptomyces albus subsp. chlorinus]|uniref:DUF397 domain-containing protein n=1 Tax=Streptomyces albus TaxID=1888 RepID=UPI0015710B38|nr:DUF397 domain-containing protein [Streptomyces albus]NSC22252.1 DUF397 domain-containing protein [Streptomyces albus subsp. chlorinus]
MTTHTRALTALDLDGVTSWFKSSYSSGSGNNCVEIADLTHTAHRVVAIRDSKNPEGPIVLIEPERFAALVEGVRGGRLAA